MSFKKLEYYNFIWQKSSLPFRKIQVYFIIVFWGQETQTIATRYYGSNFLCYSNAKALTQSFVKAVEELYKKNNTAAMG